MKIKIIIPLLVLCLMLSGCMSWMDGSYSSVNPHTERRPQTGNQTVSVSTYADLLNALVVLVENGQESTLINVEEMREQVVQDYMERAVRYITESNPIGAYAVESVSYERGINAGQAALAVTVTYNQNHTQIRRINRAEGMEEAKQLIEEGLEECASAVVMRVSHFQDMDFPQFVEDFAAANPNLVMEQPQLTISMYPETGTDRVLEIHFTYQNSRESLRSMQSWVRPLFTSAELYVTGNESQAERYSQLYNFLMERNEYKIETSITPSYSLLIHGVGDSKAFATVFSAMCRQSDLECMVVSGTCNGEPLFWNIICIDGVYYHVDLLNCNANNMYIQRTDEEMSGYVWDYSAYPACGVNPSESTE